VAHRPSARGLLIHLGPRPGYRSVPCDAGDASMPKAAPTRGLISRSQNAAQTLGIVPIDWHWRAAAAHVVRGVEDELRASPVAGWLALPCVRGVCGLRILGSSRTSVCETSLSGDDGTRVPPPSNHPTSPSPEEPSTSRSLHIQCD
jgi:hypothetical protein